MQDRDDAVHWTSLKKIAQSPAHYRAGLEHKKDSDPMRFGRLVHAIVLGGPPSMVWEGERRGNAWKVFKEAHEGRDIVTRAEADRATAVANAVLADPVARPYLIGNAEYGLEWKTLGRKCATRGIDVLGDGDFISDLKTSSIVEPRMFGRQCLRLGYHAQLAWYLDGAEAIGQTRRRAFIIGVETTAPYAVTVFHVTPNALDAGRRLNRLWMERLLACEDANEWPGYSQTVIDLEVAEEPGLIIDGDDEEIAA